VTGTHEFTRLLERWQSGDEDALSALTPLVYEELRRLARQYMRGERSSHTLQATALVHEAFMRLASAEVSLRDRNHFVTVASSIMRRILVDHARSRARLKRGAGMVRVELNEATTAAELATEDLLDLDRSLTRLAELDARKARILELRYFGGLSYEETAATLGISTTTLVREQQFARAWILRELQSGSES